MIEDILNINTKDTNTFILEILAEIKNVQTRIVSKDTTICLNSMTTSSTAFHRLFFCIPGGGGGRWGSGWSKWVAQNLNLRFGSEGVLKIM